MALPKSSCTQGPTRLGRAETHSAAVILSRTFVVLPHRQDGAGCVRPSSFLLFSYCLDGVDRQSFGLTELGHFQVTAPWTQLLGIHSLFSSEKKMLHRLYTAECGVFRNPENAGHVRLRQNTPALSARLHSRTLPRKVHRSFARARGT